MKALVLMLGLFLSAPLFAADGTGNVPATLEDVQYDIATLRRELADLSAKVGNRGVQMVEFRFTASQFLATWQNINGPTNYYVWPMVPTPVDRGGSIPGVVFNASSGVTLPPGTYMFRLPLTMKRSGEYQMTQRGELSTDAPASVKSSYSRWISWRWTGEAGHATGRIEGDVVWPMQDVGVFTFTSATTIAAYYPHITNSILASSSRAISPPDSVSVIGMIERL